MFKNLFKPADPRTPQEKYNDMKKEVRANIRTVDRQIRKLEMEMKKVDADIKRTAAKNPSPNILKIKCKNRVQMQKGIERLYTVRTNIESTLTQMTIQKAQLLQADILKKGYFTMRTLNETMSCKDIMSITTEFQKEMEKYGVTSDMINDTFDNMDPEIDSLADEQTDEILMQVAGMRLADLVSAGSDRKEAVGTSTAAALPSIPV